MECGCEEFHCGIVEVRHLGTSPPVEMGRMSPFVQPVLSVRNPVLVSEVRRGGFAYASEELHLGKYR